MVCRGYDLMVIALNHIHGKPLLLRASMTKLSACKYKKGATMTSYALLDVQFMYKDFVR